MSRKLKDAVVVVTGASSGIGRAAALEFADKGATVVLAARRENALNDVANACQRLSGRALAVPTDVTDETAVEALARRTIENYGRIDVWVNNAAVAVYSLFEETPPDVYKRVLETNIFGYVHGARAVMPYFREQGSGVLINVSSVFGRMGAPYLSAYTTSKFAIRGFADSLRQEVMGTDIHVCTVLPGSIDTPFFQHAANYTGRAVKPVNPVNDADMVAKAIVRLAEKPKREIIVGKGGTMVSLMHTLMPGIHERMLRKQIEMDHFDEQPSPPTPGNVKEPMAEGIGISGGWETIQQKTRRPLALAGLAATVPAILAWRRFGRKPEQPKGFTARAKSTLKPVTKLAAAVAVRRMAA